MGENEVQNRKIAGNIRRIREFKGISQEFMADKLQTTQQNYSKMEKGDMDLSEEKIKKIAEVLEVNPNVFEILDDKTVFHQYVLKDNSQLNWLGNGNVYHYEGNSKNEEINLLREENKKLQEKVSELLKQIKS